MYNSQILSASINKHLLIIAVILLVPFASHAAETNDSKQYIQYNVYAGGIHALQADLNIEDNNDNRYALSLDAKTYGLLGKLAPWEGNFMTKGWAGEINMPEHHQSTAIWRGEKEIKNYHYNKNGSFAKYTIKDIEHDGSPQEVDKELTQNTSDILTATLNTMQAISLGNKCEGETDIFDGNRRYTLIFKHKGDVVLESSRYNVYSGPATVCTAEIKQGAGKWHEKPRGWLSIQEQGRQLGKLPTVWFAQINEDLPAVPVKVRVKTDYGTLFMHMTDYRSGQKKLTLKKK